MPVGDDDGDAVTVDDKLVDWEPEAVVVSVTDVDAVRVTVPVPDEVTVGVALGLGVVLGDGLGESCTQYRLVVSDPNQRLPSAPMAACDEIDVPILSDHITAKVDDDSAYMVPAVVATYSVPSEPSVGLETIGPLAVNVWSVVPAVPLYAHSMYVDSPPK